LLQPLCCRLVILLGKNFRCFERIYNNHSEDKHIIHNTIKAIDSELVSQHKARKIVPHDLCVSVRAHYVRQFKSIKALKGTDCASGLLVVTKNEGGEITAMSDKTGISWTDATWNPVTGCSRVSEGCRNCYAERGWPRLSSNDKTVYFGRDFSDVQLHKERLSIPLRWKRPRKIFVNSMSDLFHPALLEEEIDQVFAVMALATQHTLSKIRRKVKNNDE